METVHLLVPSLTRADVARGGLNYYRGTAVALAADGPVTAYELAPPARRAEPAMDEADGLDMLDGVQTHTAGGHGELRRELARSVRPGDRIVKFAGALGLTDWQMDLDVGQISRRAGVPAVYVDPDAPSRLALLGDGSHLRHALSDYAAVVLLAGGERAVREYQRLAPIPCWHASPAVIAAALGPAPDVPGHLDFDLLLTAAGRGAREDRAAGLVRAWLAQRPDLRILLAGHWPAELLDFPGSPITAPGYLPLPALLSASRRSRFVVNLLRTDFGGYTDTAAARVFETGWAGSCLLTEPFGGLESYLEPGRDCLTLPTAGHPGGSIPDGGADGGAVSVLDIPEADRQAIAASGQRRVVSSSLRAAQELNHFIRTVAPPSRRAEAAAEPDFWGRQPGPGRIAVMADVSAAFTGQVARLCPDAQLEIVASLDDVTIGRHTTVVVTVAGKESFDNGLRFRPHRVASVIVEPSDTDPARTVRWVSGRDWLIPADAASASPWLV